MRCINVMLLLLSFSFVASIVTNEDSTSTELPMQMMNSNKNDNLISFDKNELPINEVNLPIEDPLDNKESFTGPPHLVSRISRKLLGFKGNGYRSIV